jgi:hypothetical protein
MTQVQLAAGAQHSHSFVSRLEATSASDAALAEQLDQARARVASLPRW